LWFAPGYERTGQLLPPQRSFSVAPPGLADVFLAIGHPPFERVGYYRSSLPGLDWTVFLGRAGLEELSSQRTFASESVFGSLAGPYSDRFVSEYARLKNVVARGLSTTMFGRPSSHCL
jgi:hypothetical protein